MPLTMRGSVSARLSVRFQRSVPAGTSRDRGEHLDPAGSIASSAASPRSTSSDAAPFGAGFREHERAGGKIERCEIVAPAELACGGRQCSRPAIIRWSTSHKSSSKPIAMRLPMRRSSRTVRPSTLESGGRRCAARRRSRRVPVRAADPRYVVERAMYAAMSGESGMGCAFYLRKRLSASDDSLEFERAGLGAAAATRSSC